MDREKTPDTVISISGLNVGFGKHLVLDNLALEVKRGEILGVVGGSGSGKSVLLRTIIGLVPRQSGKIELFGVDVEAMDDRQMQAMRRRWGVMFQQGALFSSLTVRQNIQFQMRELLDLSDRLKEEITTAKLEMVGLKPSDGNKMPSELSGGMTKRAALARALALDPEFLFLDEPTSGLDPISAGEFDDLMKTLQETLGLTVFLVTHDMQSLYAVCDRIAVISSGKVVAQGPIKTMLASRHPWVRSYFRGSRGIALARQDTKAVTQHKKD